MEKVTVKNSWLPCILQHNVFYRYVMTISSLPFTIIKICFKLPIVNPSMAIAQTNLTEKIQVF